MKKMEQKEDTIIIICIHNTSNLRWCGFYLPFIYLSKNIIPHSMLSVMFPITPLDIYSKYLSTNRTKSDKKNRTK